MNQDNSRTVTETVAKTGQLGGKPAAKVLSRFLALEPRILLDAAAVETAAKIAADGAFDATASDHSGTDSLAAAFLDNSVVVSPLAGAGGAREILFVDAGVENYDALIRNLGAGVEVHILQAGDWAAQIQAVLGRREGDVSAIHIVSHGSAGQLSLGGESVDTASLDGYVRVWSAMRQALTADGDILIYGCDVAAGDAGAAFVQALADRTGADVAASMDLSGVAALGGDWDLEKATGDVTTQSLYASGAGADFMGVLVDGWVQDTEITAGTSAVAITHTTDNKDWKFVGTSGSNKVDIYLRNTTTGVWGNLAGTAGTPFATITKAGGFGFDIAAAGNKLVVSAPNEVVTGTNVGKVYIYSYNGTNWTTEQIINDFDAAGSGKTGFNASATEDNGNDAFGYSVDIAWDGGTNYRLVVGNPNEDWWNNVDNSWGDDTQNNVRYNAGVAYVFSATGHTLAFNTTAGQFSQIESQQGGTTGNGHLFGGVVGVAYDYDSTKWWVTVGGDGLNAVRTYGAPALGTTGGATFTQTFAWDSAGTNDVSMDDDYMVIANAANVQAYKLDAGSTGYALKGTAFGGGGAVVAIDDWDQSAAGDTTDGARLIYSDSTPITYIADINASTGGQWVPWFQINALQETAVAIDRYYSLDMLTANATGARSYHYNWDPVAGNDTVTANEDTPLTLTASTLALNDTDINITAYGFYGDVLTVTGVAPATTAFGATASVAAGVLTYNPTTSTYLQTLAVGQSVQDRIDVTVSDGQGGTDVSFLYITVNGVNDAPTTTALVPLTPYYALQQSDSTVAYDFSAYFTDVDAGEAATLVPEATVLPSGWSAVASGSLLLVTAPASAADGSDNTITVRVKDAQGVYSTTTKSFIIRIDAVNNAPIVQNPIPDQTTLALYQFSYVMPVTTFYDSDPAPFDTITYTATLSSGAALPAWLTFDPVYRTFSGMPAASDVAVLTVRVTANDGTLSVYDDFTLTVVNPALKTLTQFADGAAAQDNLGFSTAISEDGNWLVAGAPGGTSTSPGSVSVYWWNGTGWTPVAFTLPALTAGARFGWSVDLSADGTRIVIGASGENSGMGAVYCYTRSGTGASSTFALSGKFTASGATANDRFGTSVALNENGTYVLIGANQFDYAGLTDSGAAFMAAFPSGGGTAVLTANVLPKDLNEFDYFGNSVAFDQNILVVSATKDDNPAGMVSRLQFDDVFGTYAAPSFGAVGGTLSASAQFAQDALRGAVLKLTGTDGKVTLDSPVDIGASWTISSWYKDMVWSGNIAAPDGAYNTLTRGTVDHQIIINAGTNTLGVWNNSGVGIAGFIPADGAYEQQQLVVPGVNTAFTLTLSGVGTTASIAWSGTAATLRTNIQNALNTLLGAGAATVTLTTDGGTGSDVFKVTFNAFADRPQMTSSRADIAISTLVQGAAGYSLTAAQMTGWHNIVAVGEGATTTFYIDGVKVGTAAYKPTDDIVAVGNFQGDGQRFADYLDDFRIYDRALSASEIRNVYSGVAAAGAPYTDAGSLYLFSTDLSNTQVAKLYVPDALNGDMLGWAIDVDIFDVGGVRQSGLIVASSIYNDAAATDGGAVYVWRSTSLQSGALNNGGLGNGTWTLESKLTSFDSTAGDYYGSDIALDYDEATGGTRLLVGAQFEDTNGAYSGAVYAYKYAGSGNWLPEKFVNTTPQGGSISAAGFFGNAVALADTRAVIGSRWRDTGGQTNDGAMYWANLLTQGNYSTILSAETAASESYFLSASEMDVVALDTSATQGTVSYAADGQMVYTPGSAFKSLGLGQSAVDTFTYLTEQNGTTYINTVNVTVYGVDDGLTVGADIAEVSASEMTLINVLANDIDPDADVSTLFIQSLGTSTVQGRVYNTGSALIYDPQGKFDTLRAGESVQEVFTYTIIDSSGNEVTGYVTLLVVGAEDPVVAVNDSASVKADAAVTIDVLANDLDKDGQDTFWLASIDDSAALGSVVRNADGTITYLPGAAFKYLKAGETATDRIVYTVRDDAGNESSALLTVLVIGVNDAPTASNDAVTVDGGSTITIDALANDGDPDGDAIHITRLITNATLGQVVLNADGTISYSAPADAVADSFSYEIIDSLGQTSIATVYVSAPGVVPEVPGVPETPGVAEVPGVSGVSAPGVSIVPGVAQADVAVTSGTSPVSIAVAGNDDRGGVLTAVSTAGANGTVAVVDGNVLVYTPGASLATWPAGRVFVDRFTYTVQYANGSVSTAYVHVYVNGTYVAPVVDDEEEDRFALPEASLGVSGGLALAPVPAGVSGADAAAVLNNDVARMALDGLVEIATVPDEPPAAPPAGVDAEEPAAVPAVSAPAALMQETIKPEMAKPGLSAVLGREVQSRRAGADALLRHFADKDRTGSGRVSA